MSLVCAQCSRVNPAEAAYCYHDGAALAGRGGGPINAGSAPFPNQFVFPDGLACRNFDQFAIACQQHWADAIKLLQQGFLGSFFGGMGRVDLAMAAQEAAKFPDIDRGLDQLLAKLPTQALQPPKLQAEPSVINLGQIKLNEDRTSEIHLTNLGMRLLYGTVTSDCKWLLLGDAPGHPEKMFQFGVESIIPVRVRGQYLRAGSKPLEGHLLIDSNAGETVTVTFKADVPITPYPDGPFAGAVTPRQVAEKAKANPKEASPYFENGAIAKWYASNGWAYPVQGPIMSSMGAIQQFFEALGVGKPPKVDFNPKSLDLQGAVGKTVETSIEVSTADKKVVYGWATCDQPWVEIGKTKLGRAAATIPITIRIPSPCPPLLQATLNVVGNGNKKTTVPLKVTVAGGKAGVVLQGPEGLAAIEIIENEVPMVIEVLDVRSSFAGVTPKSLEIGAGSAFTTNTPPPMVTAVMEDEQNPFAITEAPAGASKSNGTSGSGPSSTLSKPGPDMQLLVRTGRHVIPAAVLAMTMLILIVCDIIWPGSNKLVGSDADEIDLRPFVMLKFDEGRPAGAQDYSDSMKFAVHKLDPDNKGVPPVKLNWYENGLGNSTVLKIDGREVAFGNAPQDGRWAIGFEKEGQKAGKYGGKDGGKMRKFDFQDHGIYVTQTVTIEPGEPVEIKPNEYKRLLNMCLVRYKIENLDPSRKSHSVGLRVLMDTCIGDKDDVPFTLPGVKEVVDKAKDFKGADVPDFVQVLEKASLRDPGTILQLNLRFSDKLESPSRFMLTRYPGRDNPDKKILNKWEVPLVDMGDDSSVVIYWDVNNLKSKETREVAFTYGLGSVSHGDGKLSVTVGGSTYVHGELTVLALVADPNAKTATLELPSGLKLIDAKTATQEVERARPDKDGRVRPNPVTWRVRAEIEGKHNIAVTTDSGQKQSRRVTITKNSLFN